MTHPNHTPLTMTPAARPPTTTATAAAKTDQSFTAKPSARVSLSPLGLTLIGVLVGALCLYAVLDARGVLEFSCSTRYLQQHQHQHQQVSALDTAGVFGGNITTITDTTSNIVDAGLFTTTGSFNHPANASAAAAAAAQSPTAFACPPPVPCTAAANPTPNPNPRHTQELNNNGTWWTSQDVPLANRSMVFRGEPGVCTEDQTRRAFLESGKVCKTSCDLSPASCST